VSNKSDTRRSIINPKKSTASTPFITCFNECFFGKEKKMDKKLLLLAVVLALAAGSTALALAPMGPPTAGLKTGQFRTGFEYTRSSADLKVDWDDGSSETVKDAKSNMYFANLGYGLMDDWEGFVRLSAANAKGEYEHYSVTYSGTGDYKFAWGLGTKYTFLKQENIDWGALFQITWMRSKFDQSGSEPIIDDGFDTWTDEVKLREYDIEIAVGPTWKAAEGLSIYGGPFFNFIRGKVDIDEEGISTPYSYSWSADVKEKSMFGGYVGGQWDFYKNASVFGEFQFTGSGWTFGTGVGWKF
jgi:hypothetical protein